MIIEKQIDELQVVSRETSKLLARIQMLREQAAGEIAGEGLTQKTCENIADAMKILHRNTRRLDVRGHLIHLEMTAYLPEGMNEGQKPWPP